LFLRHESRLRRYLLPDTIQRRCQAVGMHRLCQVVHGVDIKCTDRMFLVRSHKDGGRQMLQPDLLHHIETSNLRHLHIEKEKINRV
jgi:hypothetical protein